MIRWHVHPMRSRVIEDEPKIGKSLARLLRRVSGLVASISKAKQALDSFKYDLAIVDRMLRRTQSILSPSVLQPVGRHWFRACSRGLHDALSVDGSSAGGGCAVAPRPIPSPGDPEGLLHGWRPLVRHADCRNSWHSRRRRDGSYDPSSHNWRSNLRLASLPVSVTLSRSVVGCHVNRMA
jgi:hypothetical protein